MIDLFEISTDAIGLSSLDVQFGTYEKELFRNVVTSFVRNAVRPERDGETYDRFLMWYSKHQKDMGGMMPALERTDRTTQSLKSKGKSTIQVLAGKLGDLKPINTQPSALQKRLDWVAATLALNAREAFCLALLCRLTQVSIYQRFAGSVSEYSGERDEMNIRVFSQIIGWKLRRLHEICSSTGQLQQLGMIEDRGGGDYAPSELLVQLLRKRTSDPAELEQSLLGAPFQPTLELSDFNHIAQKRDETLKILKGAIATKAKGVGVLFHGAPGTGKTEFAALIGKSCDLAPLT